MSGRVLAGLLLALTAVRLLVAATLPLTPDEAYYWVWSRALAPGYLDHPAMVALWIRLGTALAGPGALGIRLLAPLSALGGSALLYRAAEDLAVRGAGWRAVLLLNATVLFGVGAVTMTPDTPLLFFWTAALWAAGRLMATGRAGWWLAIGAAVGLAMSSKYTAALLPVGIGAWVLLARGERRWLVHPMAWLAGLLAAALFAPTVWWNALHGWASFLKQGGRGAVFAPGRMLSHLGELVGGQAGLATPVVFVLCAAGVVAAVRLGLRDREPRAVLLACLTLPAVVVFCEHAIGDRVQANWPAVLYPAAVVAACLLAPAWRVLFAPAVGLGLLITAVVYVQGVGAPLRLSARMDPSLRLAGGFQTLAAQVQALARQRGASFVAVDEYGAASLIGFLQPACMPIVALEPRWAMFDLPTGGAWMNGRTGLLLRSARRHEPPSAANWVRLTAVATLDRAREGRIAEHYVVYQGVGRGGPEASALLPCQPGRGAVPDAPPD